MGEGDTVWDIRGISRRASLSRKATMCLSGLLSVLMPARSADGSRASEDTDYGGRHLGVGLKSSPARIPTLGFLAICALLSGCMLPDVCREDWPQWRGPDRTGVSREALERLVWPPVELWRENVGEGYSSVALSQGRLYTMGWSNGFDVVHCLDAAVGTRLWQHSYPCAIVDYNGPRATPAVLDGEVYTLSHEGQLHCLDAETGGLLWRTNVIDGRPRWGFCGSPLVWKNTIVLNAGGAGIAVGRNPPHRLRWRSEGSAGYSSPVRMKRGFRTLVLFFSEHGLSGVNPRNGVQKWWFPNITGFGVPDPVVCGDRVFVSSGHDEPCMMLGVRNGEPYTVWKNSNLQCERSTPIFSNGYLYGFDDGSRLCCVSVRDGSVSWSNGDLGLYEGWAISAGGKLLILGQDGHLAAIKATHTDCDSEGRRPIKVAARGPSREWPAPPAFSNGRLYCRSRCGLLVCLDLKPSAVRPGRGKKGR